MPRPEKALRLALSACLFAVVPAKMAEAQFHSRRSEAVAVAPSPPGSGEARLRWRNGDELTGRLLEGREGRLRLAGGPFAGPFDLDPGALYGLVFGPGEEGRAEEAAPFELTLKNGDRLRGELVSVGEDSLTFLCPPLGRPLAIDRTEAVRLSRITGEGSSLSGISGLGDLDDWTSTGRDRKTSDWRLDLGGELSTHRWSGNLFRPLDLPDKVEVRFLVRFPEGSPKLEIGLLREPQRGPMLETWDDFLVLTHRTRFAPVMKMGPDTRELHLRLFWDQKSGRSLLCDPAGRPLASIEGETEAPHADPARRARDPLGRGFSILSRNPEMRFVSLEVREWDGGPVPLVDLTRPRLRLRDRPVRFDTGGLALEPGSRRLRLGGETFAVGDLLEWVLLPQTEGGRGAATPSTRIAWESGTSISGAFVSLSPEFVSLSPSWSIGPVAASLSGARELRFAETAPVAQSAADSLLADGSPPLRGTLRLAPDGAAAPGGLLAWQPPGAAEPVPIAEGASVSVLRSPYPDSDAEPPVVLGQARLYLDSDEVLVGRLISLGHETVAFESRATGRIEVPAAQVRAVDIGTVGRILEGFRDPEWEANEETPGEVSLEPESVAMKGGGFGNPSLLLGDRIRFDAEWREAYGAMTLRLFAAGPDASDPSVDIIVAAQGNRLFIGKVNENGAFSFSGDQIPISDNRASLDIAARPEEIEVRVNGKPALTLKPEPGKAAGNGIYFKMGGGWQGWNQADSSIVVSGFRIDSSPGSVPRRVIDPRAKELSLSVPRTQRENPPTHVLVAPNGDLLRGVLASIDEASVRFHANGETLDLPRARVSSIVRLTPPKSSPPEEKAALANDAAAASEEEAETAEAPAEAPAESPAEGEDKGGDAEKGADDQANAERLRRLAAFDFEVTHQVVLRDGSRLRLAGEGVAETRLVGASPVLGSCRVALEQVREIRLLPGVPLERAEPMDLVAFHDWSLEFTPDPAIPTGDEDGGGSPLIGKDAPAIELAMLDDSTFRLEEHRGRVVVLDFWATWCGPCIKAMPEVLAAVGAFPPEAVVFCAVNQGETPPLVNQFLEAREWEDTPVALDFNLKTSRAYGVEGIPHTVVVDPEGKVAWVHSGFSPDLRQKLFEAIAKVLTR